MNQFKNKSLVFKVMKKIVVHLVYPTVKNANITFPKSKWISFSLGTGLAISETLPFVDTEYNGLIHGLKRIKEEWDKSLEP